VRFPQCHCMIPWVRHAIELRADAAGAVRNCTWPIAMSNELALQNAPVHRRPLDAVAEGGASKELGSSCARSAQRDRKRSIRSELRHRRANAKAETPTP
jgi:hypothetical protein